MSALASFIDNVVIQSFREEWDGLHLISPLMELGSSARFQLVATTVPPSMKNSFIPKKT
jgi:hypothetical protein